MLSPKSVNSPCTHLTPPFSSLASVTLMHPHSFPLSLLFSPVLTIFSKRSSCMTTVFKGCLLPPPPPARSQPSYKAPAECWRSCPTPCRLSTGQNLFSFLCSIPSPSSYPWMAYWAFDLASSLPFYPVSTR